MRQLAFALAASFFAVVVQAQTPPAAPGPREGYDCSKAPNPAQCEERRQKMRQAMQDARKACEGRQGMERRDCMRDQMCARAPDPAQCQARARERAEHRHRMMEACKGKQGEEMKSCLREQRRQAAPAKPSG